MDIRKFLVKNTVISREDSKKNEEKEATDKKETKKGTSKKSSAKKPHDTPPEKKVASKKRRIADTDEEEDDFQGSTSSYRQFLQKKKTGPSAPGSKEVPKGAENCLAGKTFVFTGELSSITREEGQDLVRRYGGRVTMTPSSKTSYVVLGTDPGPSKVAKVKQLNIKCLDEDEFFEVIRTSPGQEEASFSPPKTKKSKKTSDKTIEPEDQSTIDPLPSSSSSTSTTLSQLWVDKHKPKSLRELCGNKAVVERLQKWLQLWNQHLKEDFANTGDDGIGSWRAVLISGPPGIGKTTSAHLVGKLEGFVINEFNASDTRSKKMLELALKIALDNTSITSFYHSTDNGEKSGKGKNREDQDQRQVHGRSLIIMDEVDGMSLGDRGGIGELVQLIKKTKVPIICICNDRSSPKMKPLINVCGELKFQRPRVEQIRSRIMTIAHREDLKLSAPVVDELIRGSHTDIRHVLNMLSTYKLTNNTMDYDQGKTLTKASEKYETLSPWDCVGKLFSTVSWNRQSNLTLDNKINFYFHDSQLMPLMVQENYIRTKPARADGSGDVALTALELRSKAADSICDADLIDSKIHGTQQHWTLMPLHSVMSCVRPASFIHGPMNPTSGYGGPIKFPGWLGNNSKAGRHQRKLQEVRGHMRLKISGDKNEVRQNYIPTLLPSLIVPLVEKGNEGIPEVIQRMDDYYLTKDDLDGMMELSLNDSSAKKFAKVDSKTKAAFTRKFNSSTHPVPFSRESALIKSTTPVGQPTEVPDIEEAIEADDVYDDSDMNGTEEDDDVEHDANIKKRSPAEKGKAVKGKTAVRGSSKRGGRGRGKK